MNNTLQRRLRPIILAALAAGGLASAAQAADLIAFWDFEKVEADGVSIRTQDGRYTGAIVGSAVLTAAGEGRPGGGKGFDVSLNNRGKLLIEAAGNANPFNIATVNDQVTVVLWQKNNSNGNSSSFWARGDLSGVAADRSLQFHLPWSDGNIYFDTAGGCCAAPGQRLSANVVGVFPGFDWLAWHHYAFVKNGGVKQVWVDGLLLVEQTGGADPLPTDVTRVNIGSDDGGGSPDAVIDDVAIYRGALTEAEIKALAAGASPVPALDTDKDGMPDFWEIQYGFDPNDPSDAAKDFDGDGVSNLNEFLAGTDPTDTTKPVLISATATGTFDTVVVRFSEDVDPTTATNLANYSITPSVAVTAATVKGNVVTLTTAAQAPGATAFTLKVNNVTDGSRNKVAADSTAVFFSYLLVKDGVLKMSVYKNIPTSQVQTLLDDPKYPGSPDQIGAVFSANSRDLFPTDALDNYGAAIEGFLTPTESGDYNFFIRSDDNSQFSISTDATEANIELVAEEFGCCNAFLEPENGPTQTTVVPRALVAGKRYFIRLLYKEGGGGDFGQVAWRKVGDTTPAASLLPIPGKFLSAAVDLPAPPEGAFLVQLPAPNAKGVAPYAKIQISHRDGKTAWTAANVSLKFDGAAVTPVFSKDGNVLSINYIPAVTPASGSLHTVELGFPDAGGNPAVLPWSFSYQTFTSVTLSTALQSPVGSGDATKPGFKIKTWQIDPPGTDGTFAANNRNQNLVAFAEQELQGLFGPNVANLANFTGGVHNEVLSLNYDITMAKQGNFGGEQLVPGIPGNGVLANALENFSVEIQTYLEFPTAGFYSFGFNSDDGFRVTATEGPTSLYALKVNSPAAITGALGAVSGGTDEGGIALPLPKTPITAQVVYAVPALATNALSNAAAVAGKIVLIDRGVNSYNEKLTNAFNAGAIGVIVVNNRTAADADGILPIVMGGTAYTNLPAVMVSIVDGQKIKDHLADAGGVTVSLGADTAVSLGSFNGGRGATDTIYYIIVPQPGVYPMRAVWFQGNGGGNAEWFSVQPGGTKVLVNDNSVAGYVKAFQARTAVNRPTVAIAGSSITYSGTLQSSATVNGTFTDVAGASSPYTVTATGFYRTRN
jgi:hypothetical protein